MIKQCSEQHAFLKGESVESVLNKVVGLIESFIQERKYTLAAFVSVEGAFKNAKTESIKEALESVKWSG